MKSILKFFILVCTFMLALPLHAQQIPMYSQYILNGFLINPSLAGRDGYTTVNLTAREQWIGVKGNPSTYALSFQTSLLQNSFMSRSSSVKKKRSLPSKNSRVGVGGYIFNDNNGIIRRTGFQGDYAYHIPVGSNSGGNQDILSFGLGLIAYQHNLLTGELQNNYSDDPYFSAYDQSVFITDFNFGTSYVCQEFYVGFSMTNILRGALVFGNSGENKMGEIGHYLITGGTSFQLNKEWSIKPSAFLKSSDLVLKSIQMDLTTRVFYKEDYWAGLSYRTNDAIIVLLGLKYDKYYFGFSYDFALTDMRSQSVGTMEFTLAAKFGESARRYRWLNSY